MEIRRRGGELAARVLCLLCGHGFGIVKIDIFFIWGAGWERAVAGCFHRKFQLHSKVPKQLESGCSVGSFASQPLGLFTQNPSLECLSCGTFLHWILCLTLYVPSL